MSRKALKIVQKALPRLRLCKDVLVLPLTEHILRGYTFERTPYKETFYLWRVVLPLYRFNSRLILNYSHRIPKGDYVRLSKDAPDQSAVEVTRIISDDLPKLEVIRDPRDFLDYVGWMIGNDTPGFMLDLAVTYFLIGRYPEAVLTLGEIPAAVDNVISLYERGSEGFEHFSNMRQIAMQLAQDIRVNSAAAMKTISDRERKNSAELQLADTMAEAIQS
jgi:hypothetical protein